MGRLSLQWMIVSFSVVVAGFMIGSAEGFGRNETKLCAMADIPTSVAPPNLYALSNCTLAIPQLTACYSQLASCHSVYANACALFAVDCTNTFVTCAEAVVSQWSGEQICRDAVALRLALLSLSTGGSYTDSDAEESCEELVCSGFKQCSASGNATFNFTVSDACQKPGTHTPSITRTNINGLRSATASVPNPWEITESQTPSPFMSPSTSISLRVASTQTQSTTLSKGTALTRSHSVPRSDTNTAGQEADENTMTVSTVASATTSLTSALDSVQPATASQTATLDDFFSSAVSRSSTTSASATRQAFPPTPPPTCNLSVPTDVNIIGSGSALVINGFASLDCIGRLVTWSIWREQSLFHSTMLSTRINTTAWFTTLPTADLVPGNYTVAATVDGLVVAVTTFGIATVTDINWISFFGPSNLTVRSGGTIVLQAVASSQVTNFEWVCLPSPCGGSESNETHGFFVIGAVRPPVGTTLNISVRGYSAGRAVLTNWAFAAVSVVPANGSTQSPGCGIFVIDKPIVAGLPTTFRFSAPSQTVEGSVPPQVTWWVGTAEPFSVSIDTGYAWTAPSGTEAAEITAQAPTSPSSSSVVCRASMVVSVLGVPSLPSREAPPCAAQFDRALGVVRIAVNGVAAGWRLDRWPAADLSFAIDGRVVASVSQLEVTVEAPVVTSATQASVVVSLSIFGRLASSSRCSVMLGSLPPALLFERIKSTPLQPSGLTPSVFGAAALLVDAAVASRNVTLIQLAMARSVAAIDACGAPRDAADIEGAVQLRLAVPADIPTPAAFETAFQISLPNAPLSVHQASAIVSNALSTVQSMGPRTADVWNQIQTAVGQASTSLRPLETGLLTASLMSNTTLSSVPLAQLNDVSVTAAASGAAQVAGRFVSGGASAFGGTVEGLLSSVAVSVVSPSAPALLEAVDSLPANSSIVVGIAIVQLVLPSPLLQMGLRGVMSASISLRPDETQRLLAGLIRLECRMWDNLRLEWSDAGVSTANRTTATGAEVTCAANRTTNATFVALAVPLAAPPQPPTATPPPLPSPGGDGGLDAGSIVGIVCAVVVGGVLVTLFVVKRRNRRARYEFSGQYGIDDQRVDVAEAAEYNRLVSFHSTTQLKQPPDASMIVDVGSQDTTLNGRRGRMVAPSGFDLELL